MNPPSSPKPLSEAPVREAGTMLACLLRCAPNFETLMRLSFDPSAEISGEWDSWCEKTARQKYLPAMEKIYAAAMAGHVRELSELDKNLMAIDLEKGEKLSSEGRRLILSYHPPKGERTLEKYQRMIQNAETPGHFVTAYALRGAIFHVPLSVIIKSYVFLEAAVAARRDGAIQPEAYLERFFVTSQGTSFTALHAA